jgi:flagellar L-ring protein FlgH
MSERFMKKWAFFAILACGGAVLAQQATEGDGNSAQKAKKPEVVSAAPAQAAERMQQGNASLLRATISTPADSKRVKLSDVSFFAVDAPEPRVVKKHDLVTIIVNEMSTSTAKGKTDLKKSNDLDAKLDQYVRFGISPFSATGMTPSNPLEFKGSAARNFKGEASADNSDTFVTRITAEVIDVRPNGNLVLQARKRIRTDEEDHGMILSGQCRAQDITSDNTVLSTQLYDLDLQKDNSGAVKDTNTRGFIPKLLDHLNPF